MAYPQGQPHVTDSTLLNLTKSFSTGRAKTKCWSLLSLPTVKAAA